MFRRNAKRRERERRRQTFITLSGRNMKRRKRGRRMIICTYCAGIFIVNVSGVDKGVREEKDEGKEDE